MNNTNTNGAATTTMMQLIGRNDAGTTVSIYRDARTMDESIRLMRECGYAVTVQLGYVVNC